MPPPEPSWDRCRAEYAALGSGGGDAAALPGLVERAVRLLADLDGLCAGLPPTPDADDALALGVRARAVRENLAVGILAEGDAELTAFGERLLGEATMDEIRAVLRRRTAEAGGVQDEVVRLRQETEQERRRQRLLETYLTLLRTMAAGRGSPPEGPT